MLESGNNRWIVPERFRPSINIIYPPGNDLIFEDYFSKLYRNENMNCRTYLPIQWTAYYVNNGYGKNRSALMVLQEYLNKLPRNRKFFTIVQYDDGIINNINHLNIKVFAMSGKRIDYALPLLCMAHKQRFKIERNMFANFVGRITHPVRKEIVDSLSRQKGYYVSTSAHTIDNYLRIMQGSIFTICPRGYGQTSFRIAECMQYGSIPVYVSDDFIIPHGIDFNEYGVLLKCKDAHKIDSILKALPAAKITAMQERGQEVYQQYFTYKSNHLLIKNEVNRPEF